MPSKLQQYTLEQQTLFIRYQVVPGLHLISGRIVKWKYSWRLSALNLGIDDSAEDNTIIRTAYEHYTLVTSSRQWPNTSITTGRADRVHGHYIKRQPQALLDDVMPLFFRT